jgi:hypothetical protein
MQLSIEAAIEARDAAIEQVEKHAGIVFRDNAKNFIVGYLACHGPTPGEVLTDECKDAGIMPPNGDKAFGAVYLALSRRGLIYKTGTCLRRKGHATSGGNVWGLTKEGQ